MNLKELNIPFEEYASLNDLTTEDRTLVQAAMDAANNAYAPYSNFHVGSALLLSNGEIISANNQENAAYPSGMCAERVTLNYAGARHPDAWVRSMAVVAKKNGEITNQIISPCGACRQVISETAFRGGQSFPLILMGKQQIIKIICCNDLLPLYFGPTGL